MIFTAADLLTLIFLLALAFMAIALIFIKDLFTAVLATGIFSVLSAISYTILDAVDVAFTEVAVGAAVSTVLMMAILKLTASTSASKHASSLAFKIFLAFIFLCIGFILLESLLYIPIFGDLHNPAHMHVNYKAYAYGSYLHFGIKNPVTMVLGSFRGYDTLGETTVIIIAAVGAFFILNRNNDYPINTKLPPEASYNPELRQLPILSGILALLPILMIYGFYVQVHGDSGPGGGFQAGVILASAYFFIVLYAKTPVTNAFISMKVLIIMLASGVLIYGGTGLVTLLLGGGYLDYSVFGDKNSYASSYHYGLFSIELGVGLTVFSAMSIIIKSFYRIFNDIDQKQE